MVSISISPPSVTLGQGQSQQFSATVSGSSNTAVTWTMNPSIGTLTAAGLYAAPASITAQQTVQITATSAVDATKSATALATLAPTTSGIPSQPSNGYSVSFQQVSSAQLSVSWTAPAGHSKHDTISLSGDGSVDWWYIWSQETGSATSGTFTVSVPMTAGLWQFRYNDAAKNQILAVSPDLIVGTSQYSVTASPTTGNEAGLIVSWTAPNGRPQTWADTVGLYLVGSMHDAPVAYQYTMGETSGKFTVSTKQVKPGKYELRYITDYVMTARSAPIIRE